MTLNGGEATTQLSFYNALDVSGPSLLSCTVTPPCNFFPVAAQQPDFFRNNLVSHNRVIKYLLNSQEGLLRVFYFQFLKLCFELDTVRSKLALQHFKNTVYSGTLDLQVSRMDQPHTGEPASPSVHNADQLRKILAEFIQQMGNEFWADCQSVINKHPVVDRALMDVLRSVLRRRGVQQKDFSDAQVVFRELAEQFGLHITAFGSCYRFEDSDIFCYVDEHSNGLYLAFMDTSYVVEHSRFPEMREVTSMMERLPPQELQPIMEREGSESGTKNTIGSCSTPFLYSISNLRDESHRSQFVSEQRTTHRRSTSIQGSCAANQYSLQSQQVKEVSNQFLKHKPQSSVVIKEFTSDSPKLKQLDSSFERMKSELEQRMLSTATNLQMSEKTLPRCFTTETEFAYYQPTVAQDRGDYYDDFTKTFLLEAMEQPFRSNIRRVKNNIRGLRKPVFANAYSYQPTNYHF